MPPQPPAVGYVLGQAKDAGLESPRAVLSQSSRVVDVATAQLGDATMVVIFSDWVAQRPAGQGLWLRLSQKRPADRKGGATGRNFSKQVDAGAHPLRRHSDRWPRVFSICQA